MLLVGVLTQQSDAILRAGKRDGFEKLERKSQMQQREAADMGGVPYCILPGKEVWASLPPTPGKEYCLI